MNITMPDFDQWGLNIVSERNNGWSDISDALKQAFDQGRALGNREAICTTQDWWEEQDNDDAWIDAHEATQEKLEILVQVFNPKNKLYYLINKSSGTMGEVGSRTMHVGIRLVTSPTED